MASEIVHTSHPAIGTDANTESQDRTESINQLFTSNSNAFASAAFEVYPDLFVFDCDKVLATLKARLPRYKGPSTDAAFLRWGKSFVKQEARRYQITLTILGEQSRVIHAAINKALRGVAQERYIQHQDIYWEIARLIFDRAHSLARKGTAKLSTRLTALVIKHVHYYHRSYWQRRHEILTKHVEQGGGFGCEVMSEAELASERAELAETYHYAQGGTFVIT
jgi:hypothetical protein